MRDNGRPDPERAEPHPEGSEKIDFVRGQVESELARFRRRRRRDKRKAFALQMGVVTLAAVSTVLLGFHGSDDALSRQLANIALVCTAAVTVIAAAEAFFAHRDLWILRTATVRDLEALHRKIMYYEVTERDAARDEGRVDAYFRELRTILETDRQLWERIRNSGPPAASAKDATRGVPTHPPSE